MGIGYFSAAEGIVGDNVIHVVRELVTASELKLVLGRHAHEENIHADSLLYMISSLGIDPHECEAMFEDIPTIVAKNAFVTGVSRGLRRDLDMRDPESVALLAKNMFVFGQCMEGTQFYGLFGMILSLYRQGKLPGIGTMFRYTLRDESNHIELFRRLLLELVAENPEIWTQAFREELRELMREAVRLEQAFIADCLPVEARRPVPRGVLAVHRVHRRPAPRERRSGTAERSDQPGREPTAVARRTDGRPQGAELLRGTRDRVLKDIGAGRCRRRGAVDDADRIRRDPPRPGTQARRGAGTVRAARDRRGGRARRAAAAPQLDLRVRDEDGRQSPFDTGAGGDARRRRAEHAGRRQRRGEADTAAGREIVRATPPRR